MNGDSSKPQLRLILNNDDAATLPDRRDTANTPTLASIPQIRLVARLLARILIDELGKSLAISGGVDHAGTPRAPVAGRIEHEPSTIYGLIDEWTEHMRGMRMAKGSIDAYRSHVRSAVRENGWASPADLTYDAIVGHLQAAGATWQGTTYNRNLTIWRSLCKYLRARKFLDEDPLALASRRPDDAGPGSRAATTDEVRRIVAHAWAKAQTDKRASPFTPRIYAAMALAGCRTDDQIAAESASEQEPAFPWRAYQIDEPIPFIHWEPDFNKNGKRQYIAMAPELVDIIRAHREHCRALGHPTGPDDPVWPRGVSPSTFRTYRNALGIAELDAFGLRFSSHSFRKWHSTTLTNAGVPAKMVDVLMRHTGSVEARYYKPTLEEQQRALSLLPRIWPGIIGAEKCTASSWIPEACKTAPNICVDSTPDRAEDTPNLTRSPTTKTKPIAAAPGRASEPPDRVRTTYEVRAAPKGGRVGLEQASVLEVLAGAVGSPDSSGSVMPRTGSKITIDRTLLASLLEMTAAALREGLADGSEERTEAG